MEAQVSYFRTGTNGAQEKQTVKILVRRGAYEGMSVRSTGMGNFPPPIQGMRTRNIPGDLHIKYKFKKHDKFRNEGRDLINELDVPFDKMVIGGKVVVESIDGKQTILTIPPGTKSGKKFRFKGRGLPELVQKSNSMGFISHEEAQGDLYALVQVYIPEQVNQQQVEWLEKGRESGIFNR